jgi:hypothetical protein
MTILVGSKITGYITISNNAGETSVLATALETVSDFSPMSQHTSLNRPYHFASLAKSQPGNYNRASTRDSAVTMATHAEGK